MKPLTLTLAAALLLAAGCSDDEGDTKPVGTCQQRCSETAKDCPASAPICAGGTCVACQQDGDCSPPLRCNTSVGRCNYCESDADCGSAYTACDTATKTCVHCTKDADCSLQGAPVGSGKCSAAGSCDGCSTDADCAGQAKPYCSNKRCSVECTSDADCSTGLFKTPRCDTASGSCIGCTSINECSDAFDIQLFGPYHCI